MTLSADRNNLLAVLKLTRERWPHSKLFLLYAPGFTDPLGLAKPDEVSRRETAVVPWGKGTGYEKEHYPLVIELDCRKIAPYLLETDPGFDDPLFESSIADTYDELLRPAHDPEGDEGSMRTLCGWLVSPDSAKEIASRFSKAGHCIMGGNQGRYWLRWHDPRLMASLWPTLTAEQRESLLGKQLCWVAHDAAGQLLQFDASTNSATLGHAHSGQSITMPQLVRAHHAGLVNQLADFWRKRDEARTPANAVEILHRNIEWAERAGLNGSDLQDFALFAIRLHPGFERDPNLIALVSEAQSSPGTFAERTTTLPPEFWAYYGNDAAKPCQEQQP